MSRPSTTPSTSSSPPRIISLGDVVADEFPPFIVNFKDSTLDPEIETLYGPFEESPSWAFPTTPHTPKSLSPKRIDKPLRSTNPEDISLQITKLKALIQERERLVTKRTQEPNQSPSPVTQHVSPSSTVPVSVQSKDKKQSNPSSHTNDANLPITSTSTSTHKTTTTLEKQPVQQAAKKKQNVEESSTHSKKLSDKASLQIPTPRGQAASSSRSEQSETQSTLQEYPTTHNKTSEKRHEDEEPPNKRSKASRQKQSKLIDKQSTSARPTNGHASSSSVRIVEPAGEKKIVNAVVELMDNEDSSTHDNSDADTDLNDPEYLDYIQEQKKYDELLANISSRIAKAKEEVDIAITEKERLQAHLREKISSTLLSTSPSISDLRRKLTANDDTESFEKPRKRQKHSKDSLPSATGNTYANVVGAGLPASAQSIQRTNGAFQNQLFAADITSFSHFKQPVEIKNIANTMEVLEFFNEFAALVRIRAVDNDVLQRLLNHSSNTSPKITSPPQIQQLVTLDNMTFTCDSFRLPEASKYLAVDTTQFKPKRYHESTLLAMVIDGVPRPNVLPVKVMRSLSAVMAKAPDNLEDFLTNYQHGEVCPGLESMINSIHHEISVHGNMELLWITYTELMIYCYGYSQEVASSFLNAQQHHPFSLELFWQTIFCVPEYKSRSALTTELLKNIAQSKSSITFNGTLEFMSEQTTEVLLRTLRFDGLTGVLDQLLPETDSNLGDSGRLIQLSLSKMPAYVCINDHDLCFIWLSVITYYIFGQLPNDLNRQHWFERVTKSGNLTPSANPLFVVDWSKSEVNLDKIPRTVVVTLLLEMLSYFVGKARSNETKKPLLIMVWRNLVSLLEVLECYGRASTLMLLKQNLETTWKLKSLRPEWVDMIFDLERKMQGQDTKAFDYLWSKFIGECTPTRTTFQKLPVSLFLSYKAAMNLEPKKEMDTHRLLSAAWRLARPLWMIYDKNTTSKLNTMKEREKAVSRPTESSLALINYLCGLYSSALGLTDTFEILQLPYFNIAEFRKMPIAWINALFIHLIHYWQTNDSLFMDSFLQEVSLSCTLDQIDTKDGRMLYHRFKKDCATLLMK